MEVSNGAAFSPFSTPGWQRGTGHAPQHCMRRVRASFHLALTAAGTMIVLYAAVGVDGTWDRLLIAAGGLVLLESGIWRITQSLFPDERAFRPLRSETDYFIVMVRRLNRAAVAARRGSTAAAADVERIHEDMHHSVDRMLRLAGRTEEELGFRHDPRRPRLADDAASPAR